MLATNSLSKLLAVSSCFLFLTLSHAVAQTGSTTTTTTTPPPDATEKPPKPAPKHTPPPKSTAAKTPAKTTAAQPTAATPEAASSAVPARSNPATAAPAAAAAPAANTATTSNALPSRNAGSATTAQPAAASSAAPASSATRTAPTTQGLGDFRAQDFTLTAYSCYRSGSRVLCDFDLTKQRAAQVGVGVFGNVVLVDDGGKITRRHDAYFMAADGSRMPNAYASTTPVRYIMEFDDSTANATSVSLVRGNDRIQNVPVSASK